MSFGGYDQRERRTGQRFAQCLIDRRVKSTWGGLACVYATQTIGRHPACQNSSCGSLDLAHSR
jgi:hypothetical protein